MFKKSLSAILVVMLIFTFSFAGASVSSVKKPAPPKKKTTTTVKPKTPPKTSTSKSKTPPKTSTTKPKTPPKTSTPTPVKPQPKNVKQEIINTVNSYLNTDSFSGYALISMNGSIICDKGFGKSDFKKSLNNTKKTKYGIASITKQFTSMGIMQLEEKAALRVEDTIDKYLPSFPYGDKITIHELLNHTSGLLENPLDFDITLYRPLNNKESNKTNDDKVKLISNPGETFLYSNTGYILLGYIIEKASGKTLDVYFKENIFDQLDMKNTSFNDEKNSLENMAVGYLNSNKEEAEASWTDINIGYVRGC